MGNICKKTVAFLLCVILCSSLMPVYAFEEPVEKNDEIRRFNPAEYGLGEVKLPDESKVALSPVLEDDPTMGAGQTRGVIMDCFGMGAGVDVAIVLPAWNQKTKLWVDPWVYGSYGTLTFQWYTISASDIKDGKYTIRPQNAISGATNYYYNAPALKKDKTVYYCCKVTDSYGNWDSGLFSLNPFYSIENTVVSNSPKGVAVTDMDAYSTKGCYFVGDLNDNLYIVGDYKIANPTKYQIYRKKSGGDWSALKSVKFKSSGTSYTDTTAKMSTKYAYKYRAYINGAWTPFSTAKSITFNPFVDVDLSGANTKYIAWAYNNNVVKGDGNGHFNPSDPCTRMNFVMILWKMHGKPTVKGSNPFKDVSGDTAISAVKWAVKKNIVTGTSNTTFSPDNNLSRINIIMILYKLAGSPKVSGKNPFVDVDGTRATKAVLWAVKKGIIKGTSDTTFSPDDDCSRVLLVKILYKYNEIYKIL